MSAFSKHLRWFHMSYSFFKYLYEVLIKYRVHKICISVWSLSLQRHLWLHFNQSKALIRDLMEHIHMWHWQAHIKHVYTWRELGSHSFPLSFSLCHKHTHSGDWNPIITEQQSPLTTGWPRTDHVMVRSLGPSTEKHFPTLQIQGQFYSFPPGHWGCEGVIKLIHRLHLREISFQSCAVIQNVACVSSWLLQEHEFIFVLFPCLHRSLIVQYLSGHKIAVLADEIIILCALCRFSLFYPEEEDKKGELPAAPHSNESR